MRQEISRAYSVNNGFISLLDLVVVASPYCQQQQQQQQQQQRGGAGGGETHSDTYFVVA